jgi:endonuclease-3
MKPNKKALIIINNLKFLYPVAECALKYDGDPWRLFVMARLSAQCTDKRVNAVSPTLFTALPTPRDMANAELVEIEKLIISCGLYKSKAKNLKESAKKLISEYGGVLPSDMSELLKFPGVGRKIANLLRGDLFGLPAIVVDTHCIRVCRRLGLYPKEETNPAKIEKYLTAVIPEEEQSDFCHRIVYFGRDTCKAQNPKCGECKLKDICLQFHAGA